MAEPHPFFLGYGRLGDWANVVDMRQPVYATLYVEMTHRAHTRVERDLVLFAQPHGNELHYCRVPLALTEWIEDTLFTPDGKERKERADLAWKVLRKWLDDCGFKVREAIPALPKDYIFTDGAAEFLGYTKERGYFIEGGDQ